MQKLSKKIKVKSRGLESNSMGRLAQQKALGSISPNPPPKKMRNKKARNLMFWDSSDMPREGRCRRDVVLSPRDVGREGGREVGGRYKSAKGSAPLARVPRALTSSSWCWQKPSRSGNTERMEKGAPAKGGPSPSCCAAEAAAGPGGPRSM